MGPGNSPSLRLAVIIPPHLAVSAEAPTTATLRGATRWPKRETSAGGRVDTLHGFAHGYEGIHRHRRGPVDE